MSASPDAFIAESKFLYVGDLRVLSAGKSITSRFWLFEDCLATEVGGTELEWIVTGITWKRVSPFHEYSAERGDMYGFRFEGFEKSQDFFVAS